MKFGITTFATDYSMRPDELARAVEDRGFDSLFLPEHTHIPASRRTPWPGGSELPREYSHIVDPFVALTAAAAHTQKLLVATGICLAIQHDPIVLAKTIASLDFVSGGRFIFGIGGGWNREEMENHGTDPRRRWSILRERVLAIKEIWTKDEAEFHGRYVNFDPIWSWPKPARKPHPPVYVGGDGPGTLERVVEYGDAWMPIMMRSQTPLSERINTLQEMAAAAGRGPIPVTVFGALPRPEVINHYAEIGVERCVLWLPSQAAAEVLPHLDRYVSLITEFHSAAKA